MLIEFAENLQPLSAIVYWFVVLNAVASLAFTVVVTIGGIYDLKFLLAALQSEESNDSDDGRVIKVDTTGEVAVPDSQDS